MKKQKATSSRKVSRFEKFASRVTQITGSNTAFFIALASVVIWLISGPIFHYSDTWQLVINTGTTIITFLMVFLIQKSQNKDSIAMQLKLNELIAANQKASNRLISVEDLNEEELKNLKDFYCMLVEYAKKEKSLHVSHSIDEAKTNHTDKMEKVKNGIKKIKP